MIEYIQNTGTVSRKENFNNLGQITDGVGFISSQDPLTNEVYINGQTLLETEAQIDLVGQKEIITHTGDFFLSGSLLRSSTGFADFSSFDRKSNLKHDFIESGAHPFFYSSVHSELITGFSGVAGDLAGGHVFLNGAKLVSGQDYIEDLNGNFDYIGSTQETGCLFLMPAKDGFHTTGVYDITGVFFNLNTTVGFLNGIRVDEDELLETSSLLLDIINTGLNSHVEFETDINPQTIVF
tara:strand:+ start:4203 stop:4916 length:714 start_codon:yes stop_codon:yes gene_type:complete